MKCALVRVLSRSPAATSDAATSNVLTQFNHSASWLRLNHWLQLQCNLVNRVVTGNPSRTLTVFSTASKTYQSWCGQTGWRSSFIYQRPESNTQELMRLSVLTLMEKSQPGDSEPTMLHCWWNLPVGRCRRPQLQLVTRGADKPAWDCSCISSIICVIVGMRTTWSYRRILMNEWYTMCWSECSASMWVEWTYLLWNWLCPMVYFYLTEMAKIWYGI